MAPKRVPRNACHRAVLLVEIGARGGELGGFDSGVGASASVVYGGGGALRGKNSYASWVHCVGVVPRESESWVMLIWVVRCPYASLKDARMFLTVCFLIFSWLRLAPGSTGL